MNKKIKLLTVIETLGKGGAERVLVNTLPTLKDLGIECQVAILFDKDDLVEELESLGIKVHKLNLSNKWNILEARKKILKLNNDFDFNIIHAHLFFAHFHTILNFIFNKKVKTVVTFHNLGFDEYPANTILKKIRKRIEAYLVNKYDCMTAVSKAVKEHYTNHLNIKKNVKVIHNSFPIKNFDIYKINNEKFEKFTVLTPGRFVPKKGHKYLIEAIKSLNNKNYELNFLIVGTGPLEKEIKSATKNISNIKILNAKPHNELMGLYNKVDMVVIPSIYEAFGLVVGEAMIMNKPIVATKVDGILEIVENNVEALLVAPRNSEELSNAIEKMYLNLDLRNNLTSKAEKKIISMDTNLIAIKWKKLYLDLINY